MLQVHRVTVFHCLGAVNKIVFSIVRWHFLIIGFGRIFWPGGFGLFYFFVVAPKVVFLNHTENGEQVWIVRLSTFRFRLLRIGEAQSCIASWLKGHLSLRRVGRHWISFETWLNSSVSAATYLWIVRSSAIPSWHGGASDDRALWNEVLFNSWLFNGLRFWEAGTLCFLLLRLIFVVGLNRLGRQFWVLKLIHNRLFRFRGFFWLWRSRHFHLLSLGRLLSLWHRCRVCLLRFLHLLVAKTLYRKTLFLHVVWAD